MPRLGFRVCSFASLLLAGTWGAPLSGQDFGPEFRINSYTTDAQRSSAVAGDSAGNFFVVWESARDGSGKGVFGQRFAPSGLPIGGEFQVNTYTTGDQRNPAVGAGAAGGFVVVWQSPQDGSGDGIIGQRFDADGLPVAAEFPVNSYTTEHQRGPAVSVDGSGSFVVTWTGSAQDFSWVAVSGQLFDAAGVPLGDEFAVGGPTDDHQYLGGLAIDPSGSFVVVWGAYDQYSLEGDVLAQRFDAAGVPRGDEFLVNSYTTGPQGWSSVASDATGNFVVVWASFWQTGDEDWGVRAQRFDSDGNPVGSETRVNAYTALSQFAPVVATRQDGEFLVAWSSEGQDGSGTGVFAKRFDRNGGAVGDELMVNSYTIDTQYANAVAAQGSGFVATWHSSAQDGSDYGVYGRRTLAVFLDGFEAGDACGWSSVIGGGACPPDWPSP